MAFGTVIGALTAYYVFSGQVFRDISNWYNNREKKDEDKPNTK